MDTKLLLPLIHACSEIFNEYLKETPEISETTDEKHNKTQGVIILVGVTGSLKGRFIIDIDSDTAWHISELIMRGDVDANDRELIESAIAEFGNIVAGRTSSILNELGQSVRLTPPTVVCGNDVEILDKSTNVLSAKITTSIGELLLTLTFE